MVCSRPQGFTLIEVLISLLIVSLILFGFDAMEIVGLRTTRASYYFQIATHQLISMQERLRVLGLFSDLVNTVDHWNMQNRIVLPQGRGEVVGSFPHYTITVYWGDNSHPCEETQIGQSGCISLNTTG